MKVMRNLIRIGPLASTVDYKSTDDDDILPFSNYIDLMRSVPKLMPAHKHLGFYQEVRPLRYFLATDNDEAREQVLSSFPPSTVFEFPKRDMARLRGTVEGLQSGVVDMFLLSDCRVLIGTPYSTFSATANYIGGNLYLEPNFTHNTTDTNS